MEKIEKFAKKCDCCGKGMNKGYFDNFATYCSDRCLVWGNSPDDTLNTDEFEPYDPSEWSSDHHNFPDQCYYTEWEEVEEGEYYLANGAIITSDAVKLNIAFGQALVIAIEHENSSRSKIIGDMTQRIFNTRAEMEMYLQGIADMDGWERAAVITDEQVSKFKHLID